MPSPHRGFRGCLDALHSDVERPGKHERDWKAKQQQDDDRAQRPVWQFPRRKCSGGQLYGASSSDDIGCRHAVDLAPLHFVKEARHGYRFGLVATKSTTTILTGKEAPAFTLRRSRRGFGNADSAFLEKPR